MTNIETHVDITEGNLLTSVLGKIQDGLIVIGRNEQIMLVNDVALDFLEQSVGETNFIDQGYQTLFTNFPVVQSIVSDLIQRTSIEQIEDINQVVDGLQFRFSQLNYGLLVNLSRSQATNDYRARDPVTGLMNRVNFDGLNRTAVDSDAFPVSFLLIDLDDFSAVNSRFGLELADQVLKLFATFVSTRVLKEAMCARFGGNQIIVVVNRCNVIQAQECAEDLRQRIERKVYRIGNFNISLTASIGVTECSEPEHYVYDEQVSNLNAALSIAKANGKNQTQTFEASNQNFGSYRNNLEWFDRIKYGIERNRFVLYQQKIASIQANRPDYKEILVRYRSTQGKFVSPDQFIPAAERSGLMPVLDRHIVNLAFQALSLERSAKASINLSGETISEKNFMGFLQNEVRRYNVSPQNIIFEITETLAIKSFKETQEWIKKIRDIGFRIALDDFGVGHSSFSYLKNLPVDVIKIDGSFVREVNQDPLCRDIVASMSKIGKSMGAEVVAEYVEDKQILNTIRELGIDYAQGYFVGKPELYWEIKQ